MAHHETAARHFDLQLPLEAVSYNVERHVDAPLFESLLEPMVLALRLTARPRTTSHAAMMAAKQVRSPALPRPLPPPPAFPDLL